MAIIPESLPHLRFEIPANTGHLDPDQGIFALARAFRRACPPTIHGLPILSPLRCVSIRRRSSSRAAAFASGVPQRGVCAS
jgi:hypothetical protein